MRRCIIGSNSSLVKKLRTSLPDWSYYSHADISEIAFETYELVFVFSWSFLDQNDNLKLLKSIPSEKVIFVSTVSVYSNHLRSQWAKYPNWKLAAEKLVLSSGGKVVRFGICDESLVENHFGKVPFTSADSIVKFLKSEIYDFSEITNLFFLVQGGGSEYSFGSKFFRALHGLSRRFPSKVIFQLPFILIARVFRSKFYGYTADALIFFSEVRMIGCGVLGSKYIRKNKLTGTQVLWSPKEDVTLIDDGFRGTRIGYDGVGLKKFWHGVSIDYLDGEYRKKVPFIINRSGPPPSAIEGHACSLSFDGNSFRTRIDSDVDRLEVLSTTLVLAAGPVTNCFLLKDEDSIAFSDHEVGFVGVIPSQSIRPYMKRVGPFCFGRKVYRSVIRPDLEFMIDFRPSVDNLSIRADFYNDTTTNIIAKLIRNFSVWRLNEAIFNKFGIGLYRGTSMVFAQILSDQCITLNPDGVLTRKRLSSIELNLVLKKISDEFPEFERIKNIHTADGIHLVGGANLLQKPWVQKAIAEKKLIILGSPTAIELGSIHHTSRLLEEI